MADFLAGLVDRALGRAEVLERRRLSRFEPPSADFSSGQGIESEAASEQDHQAGHDSASPRVETGRPLHQDIRPARSPMPAPPAPHTPVAADVAAAPFDRARPRSPESQEPPVVTHVTHHVIEKRVERVSATAPPAGPAVSPPPVVRPSEPPRMAAIRIDREATTTAAQELRPVGGTRDASRRLAETAHVRPAPPRVDSRRADSARPRASGAGERHRVPIAPQPPPVAPTIQVTIGRIDVRATPTPDGEAKPSRTRGPQLTLDAYLRSRSGGSR
jgi:hypothetical protein